MIVQLRRHRIWTIALILMVTFLIISGATVALINPILTRYVEGPGFRAELEKETAKGLHFPTSSFGAIRRTGFVSAEADSFEAAQGRKAMTQIDAHRITGRFNPLGVLLRRWQLDELHIDRGTVGIQKYEPKPEPSPAKPWFHVFLPDRVYLKRTWSDPADITWRLQHKKGGIFGTRLLITPHGRDFIYQANGGTMQNAFSPDLPLRETRMLITHTQFQLYRLDLSSGQGAIHAEGNAEMRGDKRIDFRFDWKQLPVRDWIPKNWEGKYNGVALGNLHWTGKDFKPDTTQLEGRLRVNDGRVNGVPFLHEVAAVTNLPDLEDLQLSECAAEVGWNEGRGELRNIAIEDRGKFRIEGTIRFDHDSLGGMLLLGIDRRHLAWLRDPEEIFPRVKGGYLWTTVHLSGTWQNPQQDLSPRLLAALKERPGALLGVMFRAVGTWLKGK
ncbi:MAG: hypothetical protein ACJ8M1_03540 [Chthoniobacterales bacterium]